MDYPYFTFSCKLGNMFLLSATLQILVALYAGLINIDETLSPTLGLCMGLWLWKASPFWWILPPVCERRVNHTADSRESARGCVISKNINTRGPLAHDFN